jgi:aminopeptidase N
MTHGSPPRSRRAGGLRPVVALLLALGLAPAAAPAAAPGPVATPEVSPDLAPLLAETKIRAALQAGILAEPPTANQQAFDVTAYDLDLAPDLGTRVLWGSARTRATVAQGPLLSLDLELDPAMTVDSVKVAGGAAPFTRLANLLTVTLDRAYLDGETADVVVWYHGTPPTGGFGSVFFMGTYSGLPLLWTLSEPYSARAWWPCKDHPADKADSVSVRVTVPSGMTTTGNGRLVESSDDGTHAVTRWVVRHPIATYLVALSSYPYVLATDWYRPSPTDSMPIPLYLFATPDAATAAVDAKVKGMIAAFAARFGPYPFLDEKYGETQTTFGGGMENQTITGLGNPASETVVSHELAHQWWGDWVTCRDFHHVWLNEGFATYGEALWSEAKAGLPAYRATLGNKTYYGAGTIYVPDETNVSRMFSAGLSYNKAAWVLHMLRHAMSDTLFFQALRAYGQQFAFGTATTEDLQGVCETYAGRSLAKFFQEWIYGEYYPQYLVSATAAAHEPGWDVTVMLQQAQTWQLFWMPVDVTVTTAGGDQTFVVFDSLQAQTFSFHVDQQPASVQVDKDGWILRTVAPVAAVPAGLPALALQLLPPRPNPARSGASFWFVLPRGGAARLEVFDASGARVRALDAGVLAEGPHRFDWDGRDEHGRPVPPGLFWVRLEAAGRRLTQKLVVIE